MLTLSQMRSALHHWSLLNWSPAAAAPHTKRSYQGGSARKCPPELVLYGFAHAGFCTTAQLSALQKWEVGSGFTVLAGATLSTLLALHCIGVGLSAGSHILPAMGRPSAGVVFERCVFVRGYDITISLNAVDGSHKPLANAATIMAPLSCAHGPEILEAHPALLHSNCSHKTSGESNWSGSQSRRSPLYYKLVVAICATLVVA